MCLSFGCLLGKGLTSGAAMAQDDGSCPLPKVIGTSWRHQEILEEKQYKTVSFVGFDWIGCM